MFKYRYAANNSMEEELFSRMVIASENAINVGRTFATHRYLFGVMEKGGRDSTRAYTA